jgi:hypothetical protein
VTFSLGHDSFWCRCVCFCSSALRSDVEAAEGETRTLEQTILFVEANRARFRHIDNVCI